MAIIRQWGDPPDAGPAGRDGLDGSGFDTDVVIAPLINWPYDTWNTVYAYTLVPNEVVSVSGSILIHHFDTLPRTTLSGYVMTGALRFGGGAPVLEGTPYIAETGTMRLGQFRVEISGNSLFVQFRHRTLPVGTAINGNARIVMTVHSNEVP